jgi:chitin synthase
MLLVHFLNKIRFSYYYPRVGFIYNLILQVHFILLTPMSPLELETHHQIKNIIGVNPSLYEYLFIVDADTTVDLSVRTFSWPLLFISLSMIHDKKLLGVCGETELR